MTDISTESRLAIKNAIIESANKYADDSDFQIITDIHILLDEDLGELTFLDDEDMPITSITVSDWIDSDEKDYPEIVSNLRSILKEANSEELFAKTNISKPFTFVLEDKEHETIEELFFVDDDNIIFTPGLMNGLDKELDDFLTDLMKD